ncbi:QcrA and Rieske domain-containing protein [Deinococcus cellulosilyticus]|uniref:Tat pathway signal sequence domain protein n=1 Tax=Deinococcus cellulosilyticus (strain DSM 18568 / NBRC 106333 / KACC 11606 / 5516J-15) TaxID=1223518 RepID=A0A511N9Q9_DEIC1|nr:Rieske (2Fe-2S) protein [Deinococcus cellulosilyticus]GEM49564.1 Tat pathway signal sequence domain protein [Deinococcus cellulosilyticus NBRC 106333 = KACC 11606]
MKNKAQKDPHWKRDFSVDWDKTSLITRREFTRFLGLSSGALAVGTTVLAAAGTLSKPRTDYPEQEIAAVDQIKPRGFLAFHYPHKDDHALLLRHEDGTFSAFSQKCPHLGCHVFFAEHTGKLECPCHEGFFDARSGDVLAGPPQRGLDRVEIEVRDGKVFAVGMGEA